MVTDEKDSSLCIQSKNCILHKVASTNQDRICHSLHYKTISKSLDGQTDLTIELKECIALASEYCRHIIRSGGAEMKIESKILLE
jgi:predicted ArsR family transcriptional regulator